MQTTDTTTAAPIAQATPRPTSEQVSAMTPREQQLLKDTEARRRAVTVTCPNLHLIEASYVPATNTRGSWFKIKSLRFSDAVKFRRDEVASHTAHQAEAELKERGYTVLFTGETDKTGRIIYAVAEFRSLKDSPRGTQQAPAPILDIEVSGREYWNGRKGHSYHTTTIQVNGEIVGYTGKDYGGDKEYEYSAFNWLHENGYIPDYRPGNTVPWQYCSDHGIKYRRACREVKKERDL